MAEAATIRLSGPIRVEAIAGGRWRLLESVSADLGIHLRALHAWAREHRDQSAGLVKVSRQKTTVVRVVQGLDTDFSSIPLLAQLVLGSKDHYRLAGLIHDKLYRVQAPRAASDRVWWIVARGGSSRVGPVRGFLGYLGLRIGGWWAYRRRGKDDGNGGA